MQPLLLTLHTLLSGYPFGLQLALAGLFIVGWTLGQSLQEYARLLHRTSDGATLVAGLCGTCAALLICAILIDIIRFQSYAKLPFVGGLLLFLIVVGALSNNVYQRAATRHLMTKGYADTTILTDSKQRGR